tara:strand:- start:354 stop:722 length:369 start_codon:yes stop_codon:yes gene_type:complete
MINADDYQFMADQLGSSRSDGEQAFKRMLSMRKDLEKSELDDNDFDKINLFNKIQATYLVVISKYFNPKPEMVTLIDRLQTHVNRHHGSVNQFLSNNNIKVPQSFADLSLIVGYEIDISNIR